MDTLAEHVKQVLHFSADKVLGRKPPTKVPWITKKVLRLCELRKTLKTKRRSSPEADAAYRKVHRKVQKNIAAAREAWLNAKCDEIDDGIKWGDYRKAFAAVKTLTQEGPRKGVTKIEDKQGKLVRGKEQTFNRFTEYCKELYNAPIEKDETVLEGVRPPAEEIPDLQVLRAEVEAAIKDMQPRKAAGIDNIPAELIKGGGEELTDMLTKICREIWRTKQWPKEWLRSVVVPLPKSGNSSKCENYRTISLICHASKVMLGVLHR